MNNKSVVVPDVSDMTVEKAEKYLEDKGLDVATKTKKEESDEIEEGRVIKTDPEAKRSVKKGTKVTLIVSSGTKKIEVEDYTGKNYYKIQAELEVYGIKVAIEEKEVPESDNVKENTIISQDVKAGEKLGKDDSITLVIPKIYRVYPDFEAEGYSVSSIRRFCDENGVNLDVVYEESNKPEGTILSQSQKAGKKVVKDTNLKIRVSRKAETDNNQNNTDNTNTDETAE